MRISGVHLSAMSLPLTTSTAWTIKNPVGAGYLDQRTGSSACTSGESYEWQAVHWAEILSL